MQLQSKNTKDDSLKHQTLIDCGDKWRKFKYYLYSNFVEPNLDHPDLLQNPPEMYSFITKQQWADFVAQRLDTNFKVISVPLCI